MSTSWRITVRATVAAASGGCCRSASITRTQAPRAKRVPATTAPPRPPLRCAPARCSNRTGTGHPLACRASAAGVSSSLSSTTRISAARDARAGPSPPSNAATFAASLRVGTITLNRTGRSGVGSLRPTGSGWPWALPSAVRTGTRSAGSADGDEISSARSDTGASGTGTNRRARRGEDGNRERLLRRYGWTNGHPAGREDAESTFEDQMRLGRFYGRHVAGHHLLVAATRTGLLSRAAPLSWRHPIERVSTACEQSDPADRAADNRAVRQMTDSKTGVELAQARKVLRLRYPISRYGYCGRRADLAGKRRTTSYVCVPRKVVPLCPGFPGRRR